MVNTLPVPATLGGLLALSRRGGIPMLPDSGTTEMGGFPSASSATLGQLLGAPMIEQSPTLGDVIGRNVSEQGVRAAMGPSLDAPRLPSEPPMLPAGANGIPDRPQAQPVTALFDGANTSPQTLGDIVAPFDYAGARTRAEEMLGPEKEVPTWAKIASILGPALMSIGGNQAGANMLFNQLAVNRRMGEQWRETRLKDLINMQHDDWSKGYGATLDARKPFTLGRGRYRYNPATQSTDALYKAPEDFEEYAESLGLEPGSEDYFAAVEDYVLRANGPSAFGRNKELDDYRTDNDLRIEGTRQSNRERMEGIRYGNRVSYKQTPGAPRQGGGRSAGTSGMASATDGKGNTIFYDPKAGAWVDAQGRPVR